MLRPDPINIPSLCFFLATMKHMVKIASKVITPATTDTVTATKGNFLPSFSSILQSLMGNEPKRKVIVGKFKIPFRHEERKVVKKHLTVVLKLCHLSFVEENQEL